MSQELLLRPMVAIRPVNLTHLSLRAMRPSICFSCFAIHIFWLLAATAAGEIVYRRW